MVSWKLADIAQAVDAINKGSVNGSIEVNSVSFDSRTLQPGALFVPLIAENDGHDYVDRAIEAGAKATFWSRSLEQAPDDIAVIQVEDTHQALMTFAQAHLQQVAPLVVAITGSNGKTTTKDMTAAILQSQYKTHKTEGNFNNDIGLPMTLLSMPADTEAVVLEMGMNHAGEIHQLSCLAQPDIAVITMIGESHIEFFQGREGIADAKFEIINGLKEEGLLIYNGDEILLQERFEKQEQLAGYSFGLSEENDLFAFHIESQMKETSFQTNLAPEDRVTIPLPGEYNVNNALAALAVGHRLDMSYPAMLASLKDFRLTANRLEWVPGPRSSSLLNDAYNASPTSMKASIRSFLAVDNPADSWLILGDMGELGEESATYHADLITAMDPQAIDHVILFGPQMEVLYHEIMKDQSFAEIDVQHFDHDRKSLIGYLQEHIQEKDRLLFKSSFSTDLISVVQELKEES